MNAKKIFPLADFIFFLHHDSSRLGAYFQIACLVISTGGHDLFVNMI